MNWYKYWMLKTNSLVDEIKTDRSVQLMLIFLCFTVMTIAPHFAFYLVIIILTLLGRNFDSVTRKTLGLILVFGGSLAISTREIIPRSSDDMYGYYWTFQQIVIKDVSFSNFYGREFILPLFYKIIGWLDTSMSSNSLMFFSSLLIGTIFWCWLEKFGILFFEKKHRSLLISSTFFFFSFYFTSQLPRQMLSMAILLHAISNKNAKKWSFLFLAFFSHHTSILSYILSKGLLKRPVLFLSIITVSSFLINLSFTTLIEFYREMDFSWVPSNMYKIKYYLNITNGFSSSDTAYIPHLILIFLLFFIFQGPTSLKKSWGSFFLGHFIIFLFFLPFPLLPLRICLILISMLIGFLLLMGSAKYARLYAYFLVIFSIKRFLLGHDSSVENYLWKTLPPFQLDPLYYFFEVFKT